MVLVVLKKKKLLLGIIALILAVILLISISASLAITASINKANKKLPIYSVEIEDKKIAISFDCAWGVDYTDKLLTTMEEYDVKSTFFMVEFWTTKYPEYVKKISDCGHEIGTHSKTHPYMSKLSEQEIINELKSSSIAIENITGKKVELFRPPYGDYDDLLIDTATKLGLYTIQWDVDSLDWKNLSAKEITDRVVKKVKNGSIVLFHNQGLHTHEALAEIIFTLKNQGYQFVTIGELIYREDYKMLPDGTQTKNAL